MKIPYDKIQHFLGGAVIALFFGVIDPWFGLAAAVLIGAAKEIVYDGWMKRGTVDVWDAVATAAGGLAGFVMIILVEALR